MVDDDFHKTRLRKIVLFRLKNSIKMPGEKRARCDPFNCWTQFSPSQRILILVKITKKGGEIQARSSRPFDW